MYAGESRRVLRVSITRRRFLQQSGMTGAALMFQHPTRRQPAPALRPVLDPNTLAQFVDPLPIPDVVRPCEFRPSPVNPKVKIPYYRLPMREIESKVHRDVKPTRLWGFGSSSPGPTLETQRARECLSIGRTSCRANTSYPSTIACTAPKPTSRRFAP